MTGLRGSARKHLRGSRSGACHVWQCEVATGRMHTCDGGDTGARGRRWVQYECSIQLQGSPEKRTVNAPMQGRVRRWLER